MRNALARIALCALLVASCLSMGGCFGMAQEAQVAASVNDESIAEDDVTAYIEGFRSQNVEYETDSAWAEFLRENGYTAESLREYVLASVFVPRVLIRQQCSALGITLTDSELDDVIEQEKAYYEQRYGEGSWESVLASYGYDEDSWRENEADRLLEEQLAAEVVGDFDVTDELVQQQADTQAYVYNGKHSYYATFASEQSAIDFYDALETAVSADEDDASSDENDANAVDDEAAGDEAGADDASADESADENVDDDDGTDAALTGVTLDVFSSSVAYVRDAGWNSLSADRDDMSSEYVSVLNELEAGQCSAPFQDGDDTWVVVYCDETFSVDEDAQSVDVSVIPDAILEQLESDAYDAELESRFAAWMDELTTASDIVYESMPDGLSYDVNIRIESDDGA